MNVNVRQCVYIPGICLEIEQIVYHEVIKRDLNRKRIYECRCDERLKAKLELRDLHVSHTLGCSGDWNTSVKIETRLIDERFVSVMGEGVI